MGSVLFAFLFFVQHLAAQESLPDRCGTGERFGTDHIKRLKSGQLLATRPTLPYSVDAMKGAFRIHYDTTGPNAVDPSDADRNGLPDYIDQVAAAFEHAWRVEIDTLGYIAPPTDGTDGGSPALDVYVRNLGPTGYYGITSPDRMIRQSPTELWTTFLEIDNDYSASDSTSNGRPSYTTTGLDALRITCAHEFHHAVQNGSYASRAEQRMLYELTSTWMEMRCWPDVRDWVYYASALLNRPATWPMSRSSAQTGYVWGWFGNVLSTLPGNVLRSTWDIIGKGTLPFAALVDACAKSGTPINDAFCIAVEAMYRTGSRGGSNTIMPGATELPEIAVSTPIDVVGTGSTLTGSMAPFEVRAFRFNLTNPSGVRASADAIVSLVDGKILAVDSLRDRYLSYELSLSSAPSSSDVPISSTGWGIRTRPDAHCLLVEGIALLENGIIFPQPLDLSSTQTLYVPVSGAQIGDSVGISILDLSMRPVQQVQQATISIVERRIVASVMIDADIPPGPYLLFVDDRRNQPTMHKIYIR